VKLTDEQLQAINALVDLVKETFRKIKEFFRKLAQTLVQLVNHEKSIAMWIDEVYFVEQEKIDHVRLGWVSCVDSRRKPQVLDRKPRFTVRKVIR